LEVLSSPPDAIAPELVYFSFAPTRKPVFIHLAALSCMAMAQDFHGVTVSGTGNGYTIVNHSTKPVIGYAMQGHTATGPKSVFGYVHTTTGRRPIPGRVDFDSVAWGKPMQPGEERHVAMLSGFSLARPVRVGTATAWGEIPADKDQSLSYELTAVLFADGTFYGPDDVLADFSKQIDTARSMARDTQNLEDKYTTLKEHEFLKSHAQGQCQHGYPSIKASL
jgi:hypothetical protein